MDAHPNGNNSPQSKIAIEDKQYGCEKCSSVLYEQIQIPDYANTCSRLVDADRELLDLSECNYLGNFVLVQNDKHQSTFYPLLKRENTKLCKVLQIQPSTLKNIDDNQENTENKEGRKLSDRKGRTIFTRYQLHALEKIFANGSTYFDFNVLSELSTNLNIPPNNIKIWFKNRRGKERRMQADSRY